MDKIILVLSASVVIIMLAILLVVLLKGGPVEVEEAEARGPLGFQFRLKGFRRKGGPTK